MPSSSYLLQHYKSLGKQRQDFRNDNLNRLVAGCVVGKSVLDVGCASGALLAILRNDAKDVLGIEPNAGLIELGREYYPDLPILHGDGNAVASFVGQFDTITIVDVLEHIDDDLHQLRLMHRALKPQGRLVVVVPAHAWLYGIRDRNNGHYRRYSRSELVRKLQSAGYVIRKVRSWNLLGVLPYWFSERILQRELNTRLRTGKPLNWLQRRIRQALHHWFRWIEARFSFGCGLSLIVVAEKKTSTDTSQDILEREDDAEPMGRVRGDSKMAG